MGGRLAAAAIERTARWGTGWQAGIESASGGRTGDLGDQTKSRRIRSQNR